MFFKIRENAIHGMKDAIARLSSYWIIMILWCIFWKREKMPPAVSSRAMAMMLPWNIDMIWLRETYIECS